MKKKERSGQGKGAIELIEEATCLFRNIPLRIVSLYYLGSLPFILGLLYFVADMSRSAFAYQRQAAGVFTMVFLFVWMKCWQAIFCNRVKLYILGCTDQNLSPAWIIRLCLKQAAVQPLGFIILPAALLITLPFGYAWAFFQNTSLLGDGRRGGLKELFRSSIEQTKLFPGQNHLLLLIIALFSFFVFMNVVLAMFMAPMLLKTLLGIETEFTMAGWGLLNTTFFAAAICITHVLVDPLIKIAYVLRCYYGESIRTGEDLKTGLRALGVAAGFMTMLLILFIGVIDATAADTDALRQRSEPRLSAAELDQSLSEVITGKEYAWRFPRDEVRQRQGGPFAAFMDGVIDTLADWFTALRKLGVKILEWLKEHVFRHLGPDTSPQGKGWSTPAQALLYILLAIVLCCLAIFAFRSIKRREAKHLTGNSAALAGDIASEDVTADELPEEEWLLLSRQLALQGDLRLSLRALYLGGLARLARTGFVSIARYKSNRDYERELKRKAAHSPDLVSAFSRNMLIFENVWYGMHDIHQHAYDDFIATQERIRELAGKL